MATVNVTTANTFEEWRVKTNEIGTAVGDLSNLTIADSSAATIVAALNVHDTATEAAAAAIGTVGDLWDTVTYGDLVLAANKNQADIVTVAATAGISISGASLSGYTGSETTLISILNSQLAVANTTTTNVATNTTNISGNLTKIGTIGSLATTATNLVGAVNEIHTETNTNTSNIAGIGATYVAVAGDTMTGTLITPSSGLSGSTAGVSAATLLTLGTGAGTAIKINSSQRIGVGTTAHASHKVDVSGNLNATTLSYGGTDLKSIFFEQGEVFEDAVGLMFDGTETGGISATYNDTTGNIDLAIADNGHAHTISNVTGLDAQIKTIVGGMVTGNTESGINVTYESGDGTLDFDVNDPTITLTGDVTGSATMTNLGSVSIATTSTSPSSLPLAGGTMTGNITMSSTYTVDGRDISVDGAKLDGMDDAKLAGIATNANLYVHPNHSGDVVSSADGAMTIQTDAVDIAMLSASGSASGTTFLRGDNSWVNPFYDGRKVAQVKFFGPGSGSSTTTSTSWSDAGITGSIQSTVPGSTIIATLHLGYFMNQSNVSYISAMAGVQKVESSNGSYSSGGQPTSGWGLSFYQNTYHFRAPALSPYTGWNEVRDSFSMAKSFVNATSGNNWTNSNHHHFKVVHKSVTGASWETRRGETTLILMEIAPA